LWERSALRVVKVQHVLADCDGLLEDRTILFTEKIEEKLSVP
jgi:hypothetical protein